jgi:glycine/D-amino acid oxidase-like deaminating enzyme
MSTQGEAMSPWMDGAPLPGPPLTGRRNVDVAVIGAGFTGLGAALALRHEGLSVAVLERGSVGDGASGRNAGHLTPTIGKDLPTLLRLFGRERTRTFAHLAETAIAHVEGWIEEFGIDCDYHPGGNIVAATHESQQARLERAAATALGLGVDATFLTPEDMRKREIPGAFTCGVLERKGGILHPGRLLLGLRRAALEAGAELYEGTPMLRLDEGPRVRVRTPDGEVSADRVILATNAFTPEAGRLRSTVLPTLVSLFQTDPLTAAQRDRIGWRGREGIYTAHEQLESYRFTPDGRILGGAKYIRMGFAGRLPAAPRRDIAARFEAMFRDRFPELDDVAIERHWSGPIAITLDFLPAMGCTGRHRNLFYAAGYSGHGVALASYAGTALADWIVGREGPGRVLIDRRSLPLPPEPLRWLVAHGLSGALSALDRRLDRKTRSGRKPRKG